MEAVDRLMRRPQDLGLVVATGDADADVLSTIDADRLLATHRCFAELVVARWWRAGFPAVLATLEHFLGSAEAAASYLIGHAGFLSAQEEDVRGSALGAAVLDGFAGGQLAELPRWLPDLLAYEYLLSVGIPRRARGEEVDAALEARLLPDVAWLSGGRLQRDLVVAGFTWPVGDLQDEPHDAQPDPHTRLLYIQGEEIVDLPAPDLAADVLDLLAGGAEGSLVAALGEGALEVVEHLTSLGLVS
jgi:hypothetical protein